MLLQPGECRTASNVIGFQHNNCSRWRVLDLVRQQVVKNVVEHGDATAVLGSAPCYIQGWRESAEVRRAYWGPQRRHCPLTYFSSLPACFISWTSVKCTPFSAWAGFTMLVLDLGIVALFRGSAFYSEPGAVI
jgi:hypothetical protein